MISEAGVATASQDEAVVPRDPESIRENSRKALTSSAMSDWGSPEIVRRFAAAVLRPAASGDQSIDLDFSTSTYWQAQWAARDRPRGYFDGSPGRNALMVEDVQAMQHRLDILGKRPNPEPIGAVFDNAPATSIDGSGGVSDFWGALFQYHANQTIGSLFWVGFAFEQLRILGQWATSPLSRSVVTIFPGKRIAFMAHPDAMIRIIDKRIAACRSDVERAALTKRRGELVTRADDSPVKGPSPTQSTYLSVLMHRSKPIRRKQFEAMHAFLDAQKDAKSELSTYQIIGATE